MGIKIKNLQTGEFEKFNIPALKGEKGEPGEVEPSEKVDYIGKQHSKLRDTMNANVDYIIKTAIGEFNYLDYEGQHITATNSIEGHAKSAILKGQTLVNLSNVKTVSGSKSKVLNMGLKSNTKYIFIADIMNDNENQFNGKYVYNDGTMTDDFALVNRANNGKVANVFTTPNKGKEIINMNVYFVDSVVNKPMSVDNMVIIEYQDGMENWGIPYFEGMQSVKMPVLTTTGKNLFDGELELGAISDGINQNWREYFRSKNFIPIKPNTAYGLPNQILIDNTLYNGKYELNFYDDNKKYIGKVVDKICITPPNAKFMRICYFVKQNFIVTLDMLNGTQIYLYENGTTNDEFEPYKSNILTTAGKNLFNMNRPYDAITDSQATVVQDTDQITVSSAESGAYVSANFILNKDFFAGKTVTGSCLYESDEKDIGTVQITYQDGNGEHHYQWIRTPRTFTFPNSFIGDVMLSVTANNTDTPQSNTVTVKNIQLELGSTATSYEPYSEGVTLRGIGEVKDELNLMTGEVTERIAIESLKDINWIYRNDGDGSSTISFNGTLKELSVGTQSKAEAFCDGFIIDNSSANGVEGFGIESNSKTIYLEIKREKLNGLTASDLITYLTEKDYKIIYRKSNYTIKTVDLSDNHVYSYKDTTHYACSSEDGSLVPTLSVKVPTDTQLTIQEQKATTQTLLIKNMDLQQSIKEVQAMNLAFNTALYNSFNSIREEVEDIKKHVSTNENLEGSF